MNHIVLLLALSPLANVPFWVPSELRDTSRYRLVESFESRMPHERDGRVYVVERSGFVVERTGGVRIEITDVAPSSTLLAGRPIRMNAAPSGPRTMASGQPFGAQLRVTLDTGRVAFYVVGRHERLVFRLFSPIVSQGGRRFNRPDDLAAEARWAEAIARKAFAAYASRRLGPAETIAVNGRAVALRKADKSNADMVDLEGWASATGASLSRDPNGDAWTLVRGGVSLLFALGADKVKVGGVWKPMADAPMLKDGRVFVPRDGLSN